MKKVTLEINDSMYAQLVATQKVLKKQGINISIENIIVNSFECTFNYKSYTGINDYDENSKEYKSLNKLFNTEYDKALKRLNK